MILITGSCGYIGSHISYYLEKNNIDFVGIDNLSYSYKNNVSKKQKHFYIDISNKTKLKQIFKKYKPSVVIHCAASSYVLEGEKNKKKYFMNNIIKTKKFIDTCKDLSIKNFIFLSSSNVYRDNKNNLEFNEKMKTQPKNYYGKNKIYIENYLNKKKFNKLFILRLFNVVGIFNRKFKIFKFKNENYQRLIFKIEQNYYLNKTTNISFVEINDKRYFPSRDFVDIRDLVKIIKKIYSLNLNIKLMNHTFNVGSGKMTSIKKIIDIMQKKYKNKLKFKYVSLSKKELVNTKASLVKLKKILNYVPKKNIIRNINLYNDKF